MNIINNLFNFFNFYPFFCSLFEQRPTHFYRHRVIVKSK